MPEIAEMVNPGAKEFACGGRPTHVQWLFLARPGTSLNAS